MNLFDQLTKMQNEFQKINTSFISSDPVHLLESIELEMTMNLVHLNTGKLGYAQLYDEKTAEFIVTSEGSKSYLFSKEQFEEEFLMLPKNAVNKLFNYEKGSPKFIVDGKQVFLYLEETSELSSNSLDIIKLEKHPVYYLVDLLSKICKNFCK